MLKRMILKWLGLQPIARAEVENMVERTFYHCLADDCIREPPRERAERYFRRYLQQETTAIAEHHFQRHLRDRNEEAWIDRLIERINCKQLR